MRCSHLARRPHSVTGVAIACLVTCICSTVSADLAITSIDTNLTVTWTNTFTEGVISPQVTDSLLEPWEQMQNLFTSGSSGHVVFTDSVLPHFCRFVAVDLSTNDPNHYTNLLNSYGLLTTIAGKGQFGANQNNWLPEYEGAPATNVNLSRPHITFADRENNLLIVDEQSGSVLKLKPDGTIHSFAGTHVNGFNGDGPAPATSIKLDRPNGGWMGTNGIFYVLDTYNSRVRRIGSNGVMSTLITTSGNFGGEGRGLWVNSAETLAYYCAGPALVKWTPTGGIITVRTDFVDLGNIIGDDATGALYITDRGGHSVYHMTTSGTLTRIAGNGTTSGGGDGSLATNTGLNSPRTLCFLPNGGYFIGEHDPGNRIWYVDPANIIHRIMVGSSNENSVKFAGDGAWFFANPTMPKVHKVRAINMDQFGNIILTENDLGFIRKIEFKRMNP